MSWPTLVGLFIVTGGATILGSVPVMFHHFMKRSHWNWWESFGGGVMVSASLFSLFIPAIVMIQEKSGSYAPFGLGIGLGVTFIFVMAFIIKALTENVLHQRAFLFVFVMALHNIPEGLAVGVDVAALGWRDSLPLTIGIFIQNLPEGLVSSMSFLISGFNIRKALLANGVTAVVETLSALLGFSFVQKSVVNLPFLLTFSGACMMSVVAREVLIKIKGEETANFSFSGFGVGLMVCAVLDFIL